VADPELVVEPPAPIVVAPVVEADTPVVAIAFVGLVPPAELLESLVLEPPTVPAPPVVVPVAAAEVRLLLPGVISSELEQPASQAHDRPRATLNAMFFMVDLPRVVGRARPISSSISSVSDGRSRIAVGVTAVDVTLGVSSGPVFRPPRPKPGGPIGLLGSPGTKN
jgi:hypothetical protein